MSFSKLSPTQIDQHKGVSFTGISAVFFCYDDTGRIFLAKRSHNARDEHGRWAPGAGGHEHGETLEETVRRELKEEFGAEPIAIEFIGYFDVFRNSSDGTPTHWLAMTFAVRVNASQMRINEPHMIDDFGWFSLGNLPAPLHSQFDIFLRLHGERLESIVSRG